MNTVILIILSLFATIGIAYIIDAFVKSILYDKASVEDMELVISLKGESEGVTDIVRIFAEDVFTYRTCNGFCRIIIKDKGLSNINQENIDKIAKSYNNVRFIKEKSE